jgi:mannose-binding lectin 2
MNVRYHNERADFSALDASRAQIIATDKTLKVMVDAKNSGEWVECVVLDKLGLPAGWIKDAYIGITASTGQLADNHDVIALETDSEQTQVTTTSDSHVGKPILEFDPSQTSQEMDVR